MGVPTFVLYALAAPTALWIFAYFAPLLYCLARGSQDLKRKYDAKWALVTGGSTGIGRALCEELAKQQLCVVIAALDDEHLPKAVAELEAAYPGLEFRAVACNFGPGQSYLDKIAKATADVPRCAFSAFFLWLGLSTAFVSPMRSRELLSGFLVLFLFAYVSGYFLSFVLPPEYCGLCAVGWGMFWGLFHSGLGTEYDEDSGWLFASSVPFWLNSAFFAASTVEPFETESVGVGARVSPGHNLEAGTFLGCYGGWLGTLAEGLLLPRDETGASLGASPTCGSGWSEREAELLLERASRTMKVRATCIT